MARRWWALVGVGVLGAVGCGGARFVQVDTQRAVVAVPDNSNCWPNYYRDQVDKMLAKRYPQGYVIEEEGEHVVGQRQFTDTHTDRRGEPAVAFTTKQGNGRSDDVVTTAFSVGESSERVHQTTTVHDIKEWRVVARAKDAPPLPGPPPGLPPQPVPVAP
jgi:hypothetical protein